MALLPGRRPVLGVAELAHVDEEDRERHKHLQDRGLWWGVSCFVWLCALLYVFVYYCLLFVLWWGVSCPYHT